MTQVVKRMDCFGCMHKKPEPFPIIERHWNLGWMKRNRRWMFSCDRCFLSHNTSLTACSFGWWLMAGTDLFWEKSTAGWLLVADLFWDKSTAGWWLISQANRVLIFFFYHTVKCATGGYATSLWSPVLSKCISGSINLGSLCSYNLHSQIVYLTINIKMLCHQTNRTC
jgi:hypothetical protein